MAKRTTRRGLKGKSDAELLAELAALSKKNPERTARYIERQAAGFSEQLRSAIRETGLSLNELARRTGIDDGSLSRFLRGERALTTESLDKLGDEIELSARPRKRRRG